MNLRYLILCFLTVKDTLIESKKVYSNDRSKYSLHNVECEEPLTKIGTSSLKPSLNPNYSSSESNSEDTKYYPRNLPEKHTSSNHYDNSILEKQNGKQNGNNIHPLLRKVSSASLSLIYLLLAWRAMGCYDSSAQFSMSLLRFMSNIPVAAIFILDIIGFIISIGLVVNPNKLKVQLKLILACNTIREVIELIYNVIMIIISTSVSKFNRDFYFGRMIASVYFLMLCLSTSKIRWTEQKIKTF